MNAFICFSLMIFVTIEVFKTTANPQIKKAVFSISRINTTNLIDEQEQKTLQSVNLTFVFKASFKTNALENREFYLKLKVIII